MTEQAGFSLQGAPSIDTLRFTIAESQTLRPAAEGATTMGRAEGLYPLSRLRQNLAL